MITPKDPPYKSTTVDPDRTQIEINKLLKKYGIKKFIWTSDFQIAIELESELEGESRTFYAVFKAPEGKQFTKRKKTRYGYEQVVNEAHRMRCLYWWIKWKLESVAYGYETVEKAFLSDIVVKLPDGQTGTVYQLLKDDLLAGRLALPKIMPERGGTLILPEKNKKIIEAEYKTH